MKGEKYLFVVSGPSGTGKDTVVAALLKKPPEIQPTVSATTPAPRAGAKATPRVGAAAAARERNRPRGPPPAGGRPPRR